MTDTNAKHRRVYLPVNLVNVSTQIRKHFDTQKIKELADDIKIRGILQPLLVRYSEGAYWLIAGERRLRAARLAELKEVPVIVIAVSNVLETQIAENTLREDLTDDELAQAFYELNKLEITVRDIAKSTNGKHSKTNVATKIQNHRKRIGAPPPKKPQAKKSSQVIKLIVSAKIIEDKQTILRRTKKELEQFLQKIDCTLEDLIYLDATLSETVL
jgi:ParB family transcriptional regulator, chromosome partitioning protein